MSDPTAVEPRAYTPAVIWDYGDLVELTATIGGGLSNVPQGSPTGTGCQVVADRFS